jgi:hypothetical protein
MTFSSTDDDGYLLAASDIDKIETVISETATMLMMLTQVLLFICKLL